MLLAGGALAAVGLFGPSATSPVTAQTATPPHWGNYQWSAGAEKADVRAFWLFDRTGNANMHEIIKAVANGWNGARGTYPNLPFIAIYQDDANAGQCFVNHTAGYSVASACMLPPDVLHGVKGIAARHADASGHLTGAAFAVGDGLSVEETFNVTCHTFGHMMGLEDSDNPVSCMSPTSISDDFQWYDDADAAYILDVYDHSDTAGATTTTTAPSATTTTTVGSTTTSTTIGETTTTTAVSTTTTTAPAGLCGTLEVPIVCATTTTTPAAS